MLPMCYPFLRNLVLKLVLAKLTLGCSRTFDGRVGKFSRHAALLVTCLNCVCCCLPCPANSVLSCIYCMVLISSTGIYTMQVHMRARVRQANTRGVEELCSAQTKPVSKCSQMCEVAVPTAAE